ncbi:SDR family NAD(P)-dependent oxidoreductase [Shouchella hunanensis]|uniref:SDR family NAD(P)-dependent oxidoreductase n=1 Tax=Shouchella hunanensis TaxID=766894 RepID=A0ABY7W0S1_9BACI|nr:SDR family NAD(P)-dependent oxidoreductase [Shouchella hunanensis]WDF02449.1 SDR family NAD(P)-dependent oxidoreductase [Shouchella hunanensis]
MKQVTVLGATGGVGYALTKELLSRGMEVVAFARTKSKLTAMFGGNKKVQLISGDVLKETDLLAAVRGSDAVYHAVNFPYQQWEEKQMVCLNRLIAHAENTNMSLILADNIYAYGDKDSYVAETSKKEPSTKKGTIRLQMEQQLLESTTPALIVHLPDLYGPYAVNTLLHETLRNAVVGKKANYIGCPTIKREFLYTLDAAKAIVDLSFQNRVYNQVWNVSGVTIRGEDLLQLIRKETRTTKGFRVVKKRMIRLLGILSPQMRELVEMMYLTERPVYLNSEKLANELDYWQPTSFEVGLRETIKELRNESIQSL